MLQNIQSDPDHKDDWLPLDNAAKIFPAGCNNERTLVFRMMAELSVPVNFDILQKALNLTLERLPYFTYRLRRGFFWYWMEPDPGGIEVAPDMGLPCRAFHYEKNQKDMCRVLVKDNRISAEFFHALTDGSGAIEFMRTLLIHYAELSGLFHGGISQLLSKTPDFKESAEDSYNKYFNPKVPIPDKLSKAYHLPFPFRSKPRIRNLSAEIPADQIREKSRSLGISITEYLVAVYIWALQEIYHQVKPNQYGTKRTIIRIQVPVNLRKLFPSKTLRNFSLFVLPEIDTSLGDYSFDEIIKTVRFFMQRGTETKQMQRTIYRNVRNERSIFIRIVPLFLKNRILAFHFNRLGMSLYSGLITNLGRIDMPDELGGLVERIRFYPPPPDKSKVSLAMVTVHGRMVITFSNSTISRLLERKFLEYLHQNGIPVKLLNS